MNKLVCVKYKEGSTTETEKLSVLPDNVKFDQDSKLWWVVGAHIWVKTHLGGHILFQERDGIKCFINFGVPGAIIGIYDDEDDKEQVVKDRILAVGPVLP